jgi:hypothetical protein
MGTPEHQYRFVVKCPTSQHVVNATTRLSNDFRTQQQRSSGELWSVTLLSVTLLHETLELLGDPKTKLKVCVRLFKTRLDIQVKLLEGDLGDNQTVLSLLLPLCYLINES